MAEGKQVQETDGVDEFLVFEILLDFMLQRLDVGEHVPMGKNDPAGFRGSSRSENDFKSILAGQRRRGVGKGIMPCDERRERIERNVRYGEAPGLLVPAKGHLRVHFHGHTTSKIG